MSRGSKALLSKGISNIASNEAINQQMKSKFPSVKWPFHLRLKHNGMRSVQASTEKF